MTRERIGALVLAGVALVIVVASQFGRGAEAAPVVIASVPVSAAGAAPLASPAAPVVEKGAEAVAAKVEPAPVEVAEVPVPAAKPATDPCATSFEVFAEDGAMLGLTLLAPCRAGERVVLQHGGLTIAMQTLATGSLFATLPALDMAGKVEARFGDGAVLEAAAAVPELAGLRRFAVQWADADRFAVNGFEGAADFGDAGHRTVANGGVIALGDPALEPALLAEVYTFPDPQSARVTVEAEVTDATCGRELTGETLYSADGAVRADDLTLAMPACDALGGFVVLNNPLPDMTLAAAE